MHIVAHVLAGIVHMANKQSILVWLMFVQEDKAGESSGASGSKGSVASVSWSSFPCLSCHHVVCYRPTTLLEQRPRRSHQLSLSLSLEMSLVGHFTLPSPECCHSMLSNVSHFGSGDTGLSPRQQEGLCSAAHIPRRCEPWTPLWNCSSNLP